ncbi:MAG TPA: hypothetical protein VD968_10425 [Pyrinomonadaceae bacterium]|nr:hypothetical protein [Pyrinomonadaceae bacterium]
MKPPAGFVWLDSPFEGAIAATAMQPAQEPVFDRLLGGLREVALESDPPPGAPEFARVRELCERAARAVRRHLRALFPERRRYDEYWDKWHDVEPGPGAYTTERLKSEVLTKLGEKMAPQTPRAMRPRVWRRSLEIFRATATAEKMLEHPFRLMRNLEDCGRGTHDAGWLARCEQLTSASGGVGDAQALAALFELSREAGWWWPMRRIAILTERPTAVGCDESGRLHSGTGPALAYRDGLEFYAWRGTEVPPEIIKGRERMTVRTIDDEWNVELRRVLIELYGAERFLLDGNARVIDEGELGTLYLRDMDGDEPLVMVKVRNSTPEPDGSHKDYFLRVPPNVKTAREAVAWTFGLEASGYEPSVET